MQIYLYVFFSIIGLCMGSFYNVVILRSLSEESIIFPPSKCPKCGERLKPWHNIPVLSYIFLKGKCAFCKEKISIQYPIIELITMGLFLSCYIKFGLTLECLFAIIVTSLLLIMSMTDLKEKLVDCNLAIGLAIIGVIYSTITYGAFGDSILGLVVAVILMELLARTGHFFSKGRAFGEADTYVAGALGACFGLTNLTQILIYSLVASMLFVIPAFAYKQYKNNNKSTCILLILFILSALAYQTIIQNLYTFIALAGTGITLAITVVRNIKTESEPLYLPLVPAFYLGALYFLFF